MNICLYEDYNWLNFLPLAYLRPVFELICGGERLVDKVQRLAKPTSFSVRPALREVVAERFPTLLSAKAGSEPTLYLNGSALWQSLPECLGNESWVGTDMLGRIACVFVAGDRWFDPDLFLHEHELQEELAHLPRRSVGDCCTVLHWPWELIDHQEALLIKDLERQLAERESVPVELLPAVYLVNANQISIGRNVTLMPCVVLDATKGPIVIEDDVRIMPHTTIQGPCYIGRKTLVQPGTSIAGGTYVGPVCKIGGELETSIIHGFTNKQHDGFLGHSYLGEWINIGAGTMNSDLKNTYGTIKVPINGIRRETGKQFLGMLVGDHAKIGINVAIPTGAVVGLSTNVFKARCELFSPSYMWLMEDESSPFDLAKAEEIAGRMMARRQRSMSAAELELFRHSWQVARAVEVYSHQHQQPTVERMLA